MARRTTVTFVTRDELQSILDDPESVGELDVSSDRELDTYLPQTIAWALTGSAWTSPEASGPLGAVFGGYEHVNTERLEDGVFHVTMPEKVRTVSTALDEVDIPDVVVRLLEADLWSLVEEEELYELESFLADGADVGAIVQRDLEQLRDAYRTAVEAELGTVVWTS